MFIEIYMNFFILMFLIWLDILVIENNFFSWKIFNLNVIYFMYVWKNFFLIFVLKNDFNLLFLKIY